MIEVALKTAIDWLKQGLYIPLAILIIGVIVGFLINYVIKTSEKREKYLLETIDKKEIEAKEDKQALMNFIKDVNKTLNDITTCIKGVQSQVEVSMDKMGMRLDYIEKKIDDIH